LPATERPALGRVHQQRLERAALALAGGGVEGGVERAVEHRHHHEVRQHAGDAGRARLRAGEVAVLDLHRLEQLRRDAAQRRLSSARSRLKPPSSRSIRAVLASERWFALSETISTTGDVAAHERRLEIGGHDDDRIAEGRAAQPRLEVGRRFLDDVGLALEEVAQRRRVGDAGDVDLALLGARLERRDQPGDREQDERSHQHRRHHTVASVRRSRKASLSSLRRTTSTAASDRLMAALRHRAAARRGVRSCRAQSRAPDRTRA
jgi:hypothetical protein